MMLGTVGSLAVNHKHRQPVFAVLSIAKQPEEAVKLRLGSHSQVSRDTGNNFI